MIALRNHIGFVSLKELCSFKREIFIFFIPSLIKKKKKRTFFYSMKFNCYNWGLMYMCNSFINLAFIFTVQWQESFDHLSFFFLGLDG
jgi:hypothetical protein